MNGFPCKACIGRYRYRVITNCVNGVCISAKTLIGLGYATCKCTGSKPGNLNTPLFLPEVPEPFLFGPPVPPVPPPIPVPPPVPGPPPVPPAPPAPPPMVNPPACGNAIPLKPIVNIGNFNVVNESILPNAQFQAQIDLVQAQIDLSFAPHWGLTCTLVNAPAQILPQPPALNVALKNGKSDFAGACAYHAGYGANVFLDDPRCGWQAAFSHEILEMLANPSPDGFPQGKWGGVVAFSGKNGRFIVEVCDPVNEMEYAGGKLSNFVYPSWFIPGSPCPWDYLQLLSGPMTFSDWGSQQFQEDLPVPKTWNANILGLSELS